MGANADAAAAAAAAAAAVMSTAVNSDYIRDCREALAHLSHIFRTYWCGVNLSLKIGYAGGYLLT